MRKNLKIWALALVFFWGTYAGEALAQSAARESMDASIEQSNGQYSEMDLNYMSSLGMQQKAWNNPTEHLGEGQTKPGYSKYYWKPDLVLPIRIREGMVTLINFPSWELLETVWIGAQEAFSGQFPAPNALLVHANSGFLGVDSNMIVFGRSGNRYVFYLRSETYNTDRITNSVIDIIVNDVNLIPDETGRTPVSTGAATPGGAATAGLSRSAAYAQMSGSARKTVQEAEGWLEDIPVDPEKLRFDIDIFAPNPEDMELAPERVWRDEIFTYIDLGPKALSMLQRPIVNLLVQGSEVPIGFRTRGPNGRLIVVEGIGDLILRNGRRILCLKIRKDPAFGTEWVEYEPSVQPAWSPGPMITTPVGGASNGGAATGGMMNAMGGGAAAYAAGAAGGIVPQGGAFTANTFASNSFAGNSYASGAASSAGALFGYGASGRRFGVGGGRRNTGASQENIAIELGSDSEMAALERKWDNIARKNKDLLSGFDPYFSVDTVAEGESKDLFRLRIGPVESIKEGDKLCNQLGRRGVTCMVVRTQ